MMYVVLFRAVMGAVQGQVGRVARRRTRSSRSGRPGVVGGANVKFLEARNVETLRLVAAAARGIIPGC